MALPYTVCLVKIQLYLKHGYQEQLGHKYSRINWFQLSIVAVLWVIVKMSLYVSFGCVTIGHRWLSLSMGFGSNVIHNSLPTSALLQRTLIASHITAIKPTIFKIQSGVVTHCQNWLLNWCLQMLVLSSVYMLHCFCYSE